MKILHTSDLHISSPLSSRLPSDKVKERKAELFATFERMAEEAVYRRARLFIISGDLFDSERITRTAAEKALGIMGRYSALDFLYLPGNHEKAALLGAGVPFPKNLHIFGEDWTSFDFDNVTVTGRSEIAPNMFDTLSLPLGRTNILVLHGALAEGRTAGENIGLRDLKGKGIDYLALGHYHSYGTAELDDGIYAVYSGTPEGRGFDEAGEKGFVLIDTDYKHPHHSFIPFAKRRMCIIDADITGLTRRVDIEDRCETACAAARSTDIVRLRITGSHAPEVLIDAESVAAKLAPRFYYLEARDESRLSIDPETYRLDKSLKGEFIRLCLSKADLSEDEKEKIIRTGLAALMGEEDEI